MDYIYIVTSIFKYALLYTFIMDMLWNTIMYLYKTYYTLEYVVCTSKLMLNWNKAKWPKIKNLKNRLFNIKNLSNFMWYFGSDNL
jgi:hypothetical protein